ncbi:hypothetical protein BH10BAC4_BH10BAC4_07090 [soil metagenome]
MNLTKILTVVLISGSLVLAYYLYSGVQRVIDDRAVIESTEAAVIDKLKLIREAESVYQEQNGKYTANWDSLVQFIENGMVPIVQRREIIEQQAYGGEKVTIKTDTLGYVSAKERIFKKTYTMNASDNGVFMGYKVKPGDQVLKNMKAYLIKVPERSSPNEPVFQEAGIVENLADVKVGESLTKGKVLITFSNYVFNKNTDLTKLGEVPGSGLKFDIFVKKIDRNGLKVDVIEVKDPQPINKARKESNDQKTRKPLRFGSRADAATAGNWEI